METDFARELIGVIKAEHGRRLASLAREHPEIAYDVWVGNHEPFINELCLVLLLAVWHESERVLIHMAACVTDDGRDLGEDEYRERVMELHRKMAQKRERAWERINRLLKLEEASEWRHMRTLQLLANSYKHNLSTKPSNMLLAHLGLEPEDNRPYGSLSESPAIQEGLAESLDLQEADYCDIADELMNRASRFLAEVREKSSLSKVKWGPVQLLPPL
jgi:hypothetical protein